MLIDTLNTLPPGFKKIGSFGTGLRIIKGEEIEYVTVTHRPPKKPIIKIKRWKIRKAQDHA